VAEPLPTEKLLDLYRIALDEYRFVVRLGWDRTTYFLVLNSAILTVATGLLKFENPPAVYLFIALLFLLGCGTSIVGSISIARSHEYYRRTVVTKTLVEKRLGLMDSIPGMDPSLNLAIATTKGQGDHMRILNDPEAWVARKLRRSTITYWLRYILIALAGVDLCGAATSILMMIYALGNRQALRLLRVALFSN
jgi:hypothetical protein